MMQEDYTRSKQDVATRAKEVEGIFNTLTAKEKELIQRESTMAERQKMLDSILSGKPNGSDKKVEIADDDVMTGKQARELLKQTTEDLKKEFNETLGKTSAQLQQERQYERWEDLTQKTIKSVQEENPILKRLPHIDVVLKREAMKDNPKTEGEMVDSMVKAAKNLAKGLDEEYDNRVKEKAIRRQKVQESAPDRTTGQPVFSTKKTYMKGNGRSVDWKSIEDDVIAAIEGAED